MINHFYLKRNLHVSKMPKPGIECEVQSSDYKTYFLLLVFLL